jgi:hypothetical protein
MYGRLWCSVRQTKQCMADWAMHDRLGSVRQTKQCMADWIVPYSTVGMVCGKKGSAWQVGLWGRLSVTWFTGMYVADLVV